MPESDCDAAGATESGKPSMMLMDIHYPDTIAEVVAQVRRRLCVRGIVQGVGFRPFVHRLALHCELAGHVRNDAAGVSIEIEGSPRAIAEFESALRTQAPARSHIDAIEAFDIHPLRVPGFTILDSASGAVSTAIGPDGAVCADCLHEMCDPEDRRARYAFINCTQCGPRYTISRSLPYDRASTSMARFALCPACAREYVDVADRRFHAEPNACPQCGPRLDWRDAAGLVALDAGARADASPGTRVELDVVAHAVTRLLAGDIVAIKGLGGFHLACDARNPVAVARLRERKQREEKPFAVMAANLESLRALVQHDTDAAALLESAERPIVLMRKTPACDIDLAGVAPDVAWLGAMLPATPLQYLLFHEAAGRPAGSDWLEHAQSMLLVMTSANPHGEPLVRDNDEALERLAGIADGFVLHDRDIVARCDDSVLRIGSDRAPQFVRRARGYTPLAIALSRTAPSVLAFGAWFKNTVCLTRGSEAFVSQHIGDLDNAATCRFLDETVDHLQAVLDVRPAAIAHDLHPDFHSSLRAAELGERLGVPVFAIQHHHAHIASVMAEHRIEGPLLGLALDGVGLGLDGGAWGGELLRVEGGQMERIGHVRELPLAGGDRAAREPWRMAAAVLQQLGRGDEIPRRFAHRSGAATIADMLARGVNTPPTSSLGRWFDAAASLFGVCDTMSYEGQAAMRLEGCVQNWTGKESDCALTLSASNVLDLLPVLAPLIDLPDRALAAARFHIGVADALVAWTAAAAHRAGIVDVVASGGCMLNAILAARLRTGLAAHGLHLYEARQLPPNDGGIALGQAWVAHRLLSTGGN